MFCPVLFFPFLLRLLLSFFVFLTYTHTRKVYSNAEKADVWVKVAEAYLESDETDAADNFCNKVRKDKLGNPKCHLPLVLSMPLEDTKTNDFPSKRVPNTKIPPICPTRAPKRYTDNLSPTPRMNYHSQKPTHLSCPCP